MKKITDNMYEPDFNALDLQYEMNMSRSNLFRKLKALTGESASSLIRIIRLKAAAELIRKGEENITSILMTVGFNNPSYFARRFKEYFGKTPSEFKRDPEAK